MPRTFVCVLCSLVTPSASLMSRAQNALGWTQSSCRASMIRQRLRGILRTTITTCVPWTALGFLAGLVFQLDLIPGVHAGLGRPIPGGLVTVCTLIGAMIGAINGLTLSGLVLATERGKKLEDLRAWRFATWGGVATAGTLALLFHSPIVAGIGAVLGAGAGVAALSAARRANARLVGTTPSIQHLS